MLLSLFAYNSSLMQKQILIGVVVLGLIAAGMYFVTAHGPTISSGTDTTATGVVSSGGGIDVIGSGPVTITPVEEPKAPDFKKPLSFNASESAEVRAALDQRFRAILQTLEKDPTNMEAWAYLGILRKTVGDYAGAEEAWKYLAELYPTSTVPFDNLGSLYLDFIKDYPKAEANFKKSIQINPANINAYQQLFALYTVYGYKGRAEASALVEQGLKDSPNNETLLQLKSQLQ